jgi:hypothetical protein
MSKTSRYIVSVLVISLLLSVTQLFFACKADLSGKIKMSESNMSDSGSQVRFIGQWLNEGKRETLVRDFVRQYAFQNQEVDVVLKFPENIYFDRSDNYSNQRFISKIMDDPSPEWDIIRINDQFEEVVSFSGDTAWAKKYLVDFSTIPEFRRNTRPELLSDDIKNRWGGIIPGPFVEGQYWALWSNVEVAKKVGIEIKQYDMTPQDLVGYVKAVDTYNKNNPGDQIVALHDASDWRTAFALAYHLYVSELNDRQMLLSKQITEKKLQAWHKVLKVLEEMSYYSPLDTNVKNITWSDSRFDLINGKCLFYINGSWMYNIWEAEDPVNTMNCFPNEYPSFSDCDIYPGAYQIMWAVLKKSPNKDAAVDFLLALNTPDVAEMWVQYTKCPTGIKGKLTDVSFGSDQYESFSNYIAAQYADKMYKYTEVLSEYMIGSSDNLDTKFREVLQGKLTANEAMEIIRAAIPEDLKE